MLKAFVHFFIVNGGLIRKYVMIVFGFGLLVLQGCASGGGKVISVEEFNQRSSNSASATINERIRNAAALEKASGEDIDYKLGAGDLIEVNVFRVEDLNKSVRVNGRGVIVLPLLGEVKVAGLSLTEAERLISDRLSEDFIQDPQVSLFVQEFRSHEITVMGAVNNPNIYNVTRSRTVVEMLSLAGGVSEDAADTIRVSSKVEQAGSKTPVAKNFVLSVNALLSDRESLSDLRLTGGDVIFVPEAGVVYVEGAVNSPGAYKMSGDVTVLQALSLAGGPKWESNQSRVRVVRDFSGVATAVEVNLNKVRDQKSQDVVLTVSYTHLTLPTTSRV